MRIPQRHLDVGLSQELTHGVEVDLGTHEPSAAPLSGRAFIPATRTAFQEFERKPKANQDK